LEIESVINEPPVEIKRKEPIEDCESEEGEEEDYMDDPELKAILEAELKMRDSKSILYRYSERLVGECLKSEPSLIMMETTRNH